MNSNLKNLKKLSEEAVRIPVEHQGGLELDGKSFEETPLSHFEGLVHQHGYATVIRELNALAVRDEHTNPSISAKARSIMSHLKSKFRSEK